MTQSRLFNCYKKRSVQIGAHNLTHDKHRKAGYYSKANIMHVLKDRCVGMCVTRPLQYYSQRVMTSAHCLHNVPAVNRSNRCICTSRFWKQTASKDARAIWALLVNWVRPQIVLQNRHQIHFAHYSILMSHFTTTRATLLHTGLES